MLNYEKLPVRVRLGMRRYVEQGISPGEFLTAVIENNLVMAVAHADDINFPRIKDFKEFLYNEMPTASWGSKKKRLAWCKRDSEAREAFNATG